MSVPHDLCCRCHDMAPWDQWIGAHRWEDADGNIIESRSCAVCGCTRSVVLEPKEEKR